MISYRVVIIELIIDSCIKNCIGGINIGLCQVSLCTTELNIILYDETYALTMLAGISGIKSALQFACDSLVRMFYNVLHYVRC